jgi:glycosyltransferase 2 family protein
MKLPRLGPGVKLLVSLGVLGLLFAFLPWDQVRESVGHVSLSLWFGVLLGFLAGHVIGVVKWRMMIQTSRKRAPFPFIDAVRCYSAGLFANLYLPSIVGGDVLRAVLAGRVIGRTEAAVFAGIADRGIDVMALGLLIVAGALFTGRDVGAWSVPQLLILGFLAALAGIVVLRLVLRRPLRHWPARHRGRVARSLVALRRLGARPGTALAVLGLSILIQSLFVLLNAWIGYTLGVRVGLGVWFLVWPLAKVAGMLPISLGGLGVRDATLAALLVPLGVPIARGVITALAWQSVVMAGGLLGGLIWWLLGRARAGTPDTDWRSVAAAPRASRS